MKKFYLFSVLALFCANALFAVGFMDAFRFMFTYSSKTTPDDVDKHFIDLQEGGNSTYAAMTLRVMNDGVENAADSREKVALLTNLNVATANVVSNPGFVSGSWSLTDSVQRAVHTLRKGGIDLSPIVRDLEYSGIVRPHRGVDASESFREAQ